MKGELITFEQPNSPVTEAFRGLRTNIQFSSNSENIKTILITSIGKSEGKSWVTANLAISFAQKGDDVILLDADMRAGRQHTIYETSINVGLSDYLLAGNNEKKSNIHKYLKDTVMPNLKLITAGKCPLNPNELLLTEKLDSLLQQAKKKSDIVLVDAPPSTMVADTLVIAGKVDGIIIVLEQGKAKSDELKKIIKDIKKVGGKIIGIVFNKVPTMRKTYGSGAYYGNNGNSKELAQIKK